MTLIRTSLLNAIAVGVRMLTLLGINKILAIYVGPAGYAALGQFQNAIQMISTLASGAINTGVTKYTAEYELDEAKQRKVWQTAGTIVLIGSLVLGLLIVLFREPLAVGFLGDIHLHSVFMWFAVTLVFFVFNNLLLAILNGKKDISRYVLANIAGSLLALGVTVVMVINWGLVGALIALATYQALAFFATIILCMKTSWFSWRAVLGRIDFGVARNLSKYSAMAFASAVFVPLSHIVVRDYLTKAIGVEAAGYWEAMWRLSGAYLMLITSTLSVYYLPRFSELSVGSEVRLEVMHGYKVIMPVVVVMAIIFYLCRDFIVGVLFSVDFLPMRDLFLCQAIGDVLKIASWILAFILIGRALYLEFIVTEIFFSLTFVGLVVVFVEYYGLTGAAIAHVVNYAAYLLVLFAIVRVRLG